MNLCFSSTILTNFKSKKVTRTGRLAVLNNPAHGCYYACALVSVVASLGTRPDPAPLNPNSSFSESQSREFFLKKMPFISQIQRQSDYSFIPSTTPIVIDNGASYFRIGYPQTNPNSAYTYVYDSFGSVFVIFVCVLLCAPECSDGLEKQTLELFSATLFRGHGIKLPVPLNSHIFCKFFVLFCFVFSFLLRGKEGV